MSTEDDTASIFSYDGEGDPDAFSLVQLKACVASHFGEPCQLVKLGQGGYHKIYEILRPDGSSREAIVRVASPAFPTDKLESEIATYKYLTDHTKVRLPRIHAWNSDPCNSVGAEYMIMDKITGVPCYDVWEGLPEALKKNVVEQVAQCLLEIFSLRFRSSGSLYWNRLSHDFHVGPIVSTPFYRALDGYVRVPGDPKVRNINPLRGPFSTTTGYLSSFLHAELDFMSKHRDVVLSELGGDEERFELGERVIKQGLQLCSIYPGDKMIPDTISTPEMPFSFNLSDFRLSNIMIDEKTGQITGLLDFEETTVAPIWQCAIIPRWLQDPEDPEASGHGGPAECREPLRAHFLNVITEGTLGREWIKAYELGRPFRALTDRISFQVQVWASKTLENWVDQRLIWAKSHPGIGFPE